MTEYNVNNIPAMQEEKVGYRSQTDSHSMNEQNSQVFQDILDLFNKTNALEKSINESMMATNIESKCYSTRLNDTITNMALLTEQYINLKADSKDMRTITRYAFQAFVLSASRFSAFIDTSTADIVSNTFSSTSKTRIYDETYDEYLIPPSLKVYIGPDSFKQDQRILSIEDTDINNAFNGDISSVWMRKVITDTSVEFIENEIIVGLPEDIITTRNVNQITIRPFPNGYIDIVDVMFKVNGAWTSVPEFKNHYGNVLVEYHDIFQNLMTYTALEDASDIKLNFSDIQTNQIKIKFKQRHYEYDEQNNRRIWYLGLREFDVAYNSYSKYQSEFAMVYDFPETESKIKIFDTKVYLNNEKYSDTEPSSHNIVKEYYYYDAKGSTHKIPASLPFILDGHKLMVKYIMQSDNKTANVHKCKISYKLA